METAMQEVREALQRLEEMTAAYFEAKGVQGEREADVFGESRDEVASSQTKEALVVEPADTENAADLLAVSAVECGLTQGDDEDAHPGPSSSVALVCGTMPKSVKGKQVTGSTANKMMRAEAQPAAAQAPLGARERESGGCYGEEGRQGCTSGLAIHCRRSATCARLPESVKSKPASVGTL
ncbi:hypothetical protein MTO96_006846 [Rhipicephalus appendiculatus]